MKADRNAFNLPPVSQNTLNAGAGVTEATVLHTKDTDKILKLTNLLRVAVKALGWYAGMLRPEDRLTDSGDKATAALIVIQENLK